MLVPVEIIERLVSREMARRYLQFDIKVGSHWHIVCLGEEELVSQILYIFCTEMM